MRTWNDKLYLGAMPGRTKQGRPHGDFDRWLREMAQNKIGTVVCLASEEQIASESPDYAEWRRRHLSGPDRGESTGDVQVELIDIPVADFHAPEPTTSGSFWKAAKEIANQIGKGARTFIHCGAGIGRTGMFAVAVLMQQGYGYDDAYKEIDAVGSHPEVPAQRAFLKRGFVQEGE